jgi:Flp pilus assembly protein TadD
MSTINQMLRDLDARGANQSHPPAALEMPTARDGFRNSMNPARKRIWVGLLLLAAVGGGGGYFVFGITGQRSGKTASVPHPKPVAVLLPVTPRQQNKLVATAPAVVVPEVIVRAPQAVDVPRHAPADTPAAVPREATATTLPPVAGQAVVNTNKSSVLPILRSTATETAVKRPSQVIKQAVELPSEAVAQQILDEANVFRREGKLDAARRKYREALERNPALTSARVQLAKMLHEEGESDAALALLTNGYNQQHDGALAAVLGRMLADRGQRAEALIWFARGRGELRPADHALMGALLSQEQRHDEAITAYQTALTAEPRKSGWLLGLGLALEAAGRREEAQIAYRQALEWGEFKPEVVKFLKERSGILSY